MKLCAEYLVIKADKLLHSPDNFDLLLTKAHVVGTPGAGFGPAGEGYFRLTAFGGTDDVKEALQRIKAVS